MEITHDLIPKQKTRKHNSKVTIELYPYASQLYEELDKLGIIERIKNIPQLGVIKISSKLAKTRFDYVMLQLYLHQLIKKKSKIELKYTYNSLIDSKEFREGYHYSNQKKPTIYDIVQLLTIIYNIGHFYDTFTASRAMTMISSVDDVFYDMIHEASSHTRYHQAADNILKNRDYQQLHLLNSILILERCDQSNPSLSLALEILYAYINEQNLEEKNKLRYAFMLFRNIRAVSYVAYDLQIANTPITIDLCDKKAMLLLFKELLSEYNNNQPSQHLIKSLAKLLDDTVYNENSNAICYYKISQKMVSLMTSDQNFPKQDYYEDIFLNSESVVNKTHKPRKDFVQENILKLTFAKEHRGIAESLLTDVERLNNTRVGYYDRRSGEFTLLVSLKKNCNSDTKRYAAFKTLKVAVKALRKIPNINACDLRFLLCVKFFLFYLFDEHPVIIKPTINTTECVICTRGKNARVKWIDAMLNNSIGNDDENHEVEFLKSQIKKDTINDTSITIPASILVYHKKIVNQTLNEFDGMIIHPMRKKYQIIFLEAKNKNKQPADSKNCLRKKLKHFSLKYQDGDIQTVDCDSYMKYSL